MNNSQENNPFRLRAQQKYSEKNIPKIQQAEESEENQEQESLNIQKAMGIPEKKEENPYRNPFEERSQQEGFWKSSFRTAAQPILGWLATTPAGLLASLGEFLVMGEVMNPSDIYDIANAYEREGIPFDEEKWFEGARAAMEAVPTVHNLANKAEKAWRIPLEPKTRFQKGLRFFAEATRLAPTGATIRPLNIGLPKPVLGAALEAANEALQEVGVREDIAQMASFALLKMPKLGSPELSFGAKKKPSGLTERGYEGIKEPTDISGKKIEKINEKVEAEFRDIASDIIENTPIEETYKALKEDVAFKQKASEAFVKVEELSESLPDTFSTKDMKKDLVDNVLKKKGTGFLPTEYEKIHKNLIKQYIKSTPNQNIQAKDLVVQYRKNNKALGEAYEPGQSFAHNRAKRDALLDYNRVIAQQIEKKFPNTEFSNLFKSTNEQWTKIMDAQAIDKFMDGLFKGKIQFGKGKDFFDKNGITVPFKRALGKESFEKFEQLTKDLMSTEQAHKFMRKAREQGFGDFVKMSLPYLVHPTLGKTISALKGVGYLQKKLWEFTLDKPKFSMQWKKGIKEVKLGDFAKAEATFGKLQEEMEAVKPEVLAKEQLEFKPEAKKPVQEFEVKAERIHPKENIVEPKSEEIHVEKGLQKVIPKKQSKKPLQLEYEPLESGYSETREPIQLPDKMGQPRLIEYKPKANEPPSLKERSHELGKEVFKEALLGEKLSTPEKNLLLNTEVSLLTTRKMGQQFHGTKKPIKELSEDIIQTSSLANIYGDGFYTTDALDIADGYSKNKKFPNAKVYSVIEKTPQKIYDMEAPIEDFRKWWTEDQKKHFEYLKESPFEKYKNITFEKYLQNEGSDLNQIIYNENVKNLREVYDEFRDLVESEDLGVEYRADVFSDIHGIIARQGYQGLSHKGGLLTNNPEHHVKIYWEPQNLEIQEFAYPKEFKKIAKTAKPPELPATLTKPIEQPKSEVKPKQKRMTKDEEAHLFEKKKESKPKKENSNEKKIQILEKLLEEKRLQQYLKPKDYNEKKIAEIRRELKKLKPEKTYKKEIQYKNEKLKDLHEELEMYQQKFKELDNEYEIARKAKGLTSGNDRIRIMGKMEEFERRLTGYTKTIKDIENKIDSELSRLDRVEEFEKNKKNIKN